MAMSSSPAPRYAIYFTPAPSCDLWQRGSSLLGYDATRGQDVVRPTLPGILPDELAAATQRPHRYGFHATFKQPMHLREGCSQSDLLAALHSFCAKESSFQGPKLRVSKFRSIVALTPAQECTRLDRLAGRVVAYFEPFRAALSQADRDRRLSASTVDASTVGDRQRRALDTWGYPYVFDDFAFHMTLTGPLLQHASRFESAMSSYLAPALEQPVTVDRLSVFRQDGPDQRFLLTDQVVFAANR